MSVAEEILLEVVFFYHESGLFESEESLLCVLCPQITVLPAAC